MINIPTSFLCKSFVKGVNTQGSCSPATEFVAGGGRRGGALALVRNGEAGGRLEKKGRRRSNYLA
jgi:hypothetical protein